MKRGSGGRSNLKGSGARFKGVIEGGGWRIPKTVFWTGGRGVRGGTGVRGALRAAIAASIAF